MGPYAYLTRALLPALLSRQHSKSGVVFTSSSGSQHSFPNALAAGASKVFDDELALLLGEELSGRMDVLAYRPGLMETKLSNYKQ